MDPNVVGVWIPAILTVIGAAFAALKMWDDYRRDKRARDATLSAQLSNAVKNAVGIVQQTGSLTAGVQYVKNQAEESVEWFEQTTVQLVEKVQAQIGLGEIASNLAISASELPISVPPMTPAKEAAEMVATAQLNRDEAARHA